MQYRLDRTILQPPPHEAALPSIASRDNGAELKSPPGSYTFLNDLVRGDGGHVYVTDSSSPLMFRALGPGVGTPTRSPPNEPKPSSIVALPRDRWLLALQLVARQLWRIDTSAKLLASPAWKAGNCGMARAWCFRAATCMRYTTTTTKL